MEVSSLAVAQIVDLGGGRMVCTNTMRHNVFVAFWRRLRLFGFPKANRRDRRFNVFGRVAPFRTLGLRLPAKKTILTLPSSSAFINIRASAGRAQPTREIGMYDCMSRPVTLAAAMLLAALVAAGAPAQAQ